MATTAGDIYVRSGASGSFTSVQYVQGGWITVDSGSDMTSLYHDRLKDGQIVYVQSTDEAYKVKKFVAFSTPGYGGSDDSASFHSFNFPAAGGGSGDITAVTAGLGISGGAASGDATVTLNTGSTHFTEGVDGRLTNYALKTQISGSFTVASASLASNIATNTTNISTNTTEINVLSAATASYALSSGVVANASTSSFLTNSGNQTLAGNFLPNASDTYDLGSLSKKWKDLYLSGSTIFLGDTKLTRNSDGDLEIRDRATSALRKIKADEIELGTTGQRIRVIGNKIKLTNSGGSDRALDLPSNIISASAQIASEISGSFSLASSSLASRITSNDTDITTANSTIATLNAATSSYLLNNANQTLTGDLVVTGDLTAQKFNTELVSSSIIFESGSTIFGNSADDIHAFSGSLKVSGSIDAQDLFISEWILGASGTNHYTFTGPGLIGAENDPTLYLVRGQKYKFTNKMGAHPFRIQSTPNGSAGTSYNDGVTNNDVSNGTLTIDVQFDAPSKIYYQCTAHANMGGIIHILDKDTNGLLSGSAQIASEISGSFTLASASLASNIATNTTNIGLNTTEINVLSAATSSYALSSGVVANASTSSFALKTGISGSFNVVSSSLASRIAANEVVTAKTLVSASAQITGLNTGSITNFNTKVSESVAKQGFGSGGGASAYSDLTGIPGGIVSASAQIIGLSTGSITDFNTKVSQSVAKQGFGSGGGGGGGGDITSVTAGNGLSGGGLSGAVSIAVDTGSFHFTKGVLQEITPGLSITGSLKSLYDGTNDPFAIISASITKFKVDHEGLVYLVTQSGTPTAAKGALYLDTNHDLFIGQE